MERQLINDIREKTVSILQSKSKGPKNRTVSQQLIFRVLANKRHFPHEFNIANEDIDSVNVNTPEFIQFVLQINPFFKFSEKEKLKLQYYKKYYFLSNLIFDDIKSLFDKRKDIKYYTLYDNTNNIAIKFQDFMDTNDSSIAYYDSYDDALKDLRKYCSAYKSLGLEQSVSIRMHNLLNEVVEEATLSLEDL